MVYGTVSCHEGQLGYIAKALEFPDFHHEFHWKRSGFLDEHKLFASAIFHCMKRHGLKFRCIVVNTRHMKHREFNQSDPDLGLEKYIYRQLLRYALNNKNANSRFHVTLDAGREKRYPPEQKQRMLNLGYKKESSFTHSPFLSVGTMSSKDSRFVQAADVLSGAVAWVWNKRYTDLEKGVKKEGLAQHIAAEAKLPVKHPLAIQRRVVPGHYLTLGYETYEFAERWISIWDFDLTREKRREQQALSTAQLSAIPDQTTTWGSLPGLGYSVRLACAYCNDQLPNSPPDPKFEDHRITARYRPRCQECGRACVPLLDPDPRHGGLLVRLNVPR
jgi:hypothetical protein